MLTEKEVLPLFSSPVYRARVDNFVNDVVDLDNLDLSKFNDFRETDNICLSKDQQILLQPEFSGIKHHIHSAMSDYVYNVLSVSRDVKLKLVNSWMVVGFPGSITPEHIHQNSIFSGTFYIKSEPGAGELHLSVPQSQYTAFPSSLIPKVNEYNPYNSKKWPFKIRTSDILCWPSNIYHSITPNKSNQKRCVIAFNYYLVGPISEDDNEVLTLA